MVIDKLVEASAEESEAKDIAHSIIAETEKEIAGKESGKYMLEVCCGCSAVVR